MYRTINSLLNKPSKILPDSEFKHDLANKFLKSFIEKVENIRNDVSSKDTSASASLSEYNTVWQCSPSDFQPHESEGIADIIRQFPSKSCSLDTSALKESIITPVIKKSNADRNSKNYRPVANLPFLSKVIEKAASRQVMDHVDSNYLCEPLQSSYKRHHSTETALLKVKNDLVCYLDNNKAVLMVLLDMSAAFDTVDHDILLDRLKSKFGIKHMVKSWFSIYLRDRVTKVSIEGDFSDDHVMRYSLP